MKIYDYYGKANLCGSRILKARELRKLSQSQLSAMLQVMDVSIGQKAISRIEQGERVVADYELLALAKVLDVSPLWLLQEEQSDI